MKSDLLKDSGIEIEVLGGEIHENNVTIDESEMAWIISLLTKGLYSNPIESLIRELVSNAWDSHVEAGVDKPVLVKLYDKYDLTYFEVQDFGVGISKDRFRDVYTKMGTSTKRDSNKQIGMFGIGKFSPLSYTSEVIIISVHNGYKTTYLMHQSDLSLRIDELNSEETTDDNGVTIRIEVAHYDTLNFHDAIIGKMRYFDNLYYVSSIFDSNKFNEAKIKEYDTFKISNIRDNYSLNILYGSVLYPIDREIIKSKLTGIAVDLKLPIGSINITPNREGIIYDKKSIKAINKALKNLEKEILSLIEIDTNKDLDNFSKYLDKIIDTYFLELTPYKRVDASLFSIKKNYKYKGEKLNNNIIIEILKKASFIGSIPSFTLYYNNTLRKDKEYDAFKSIIMGSNCYVLPKDFSTRKLINRAFLKSFPSGTSFVSIKQLLKGYKDSYLKYTDIFNTKEGKIYKKEFLKVLKSKLISIPQKFIDDYKVSNKKSKSDVSNTRSSFSIDMKLKLYTLREHSHNTQDIVEDGDTYNRKHLYKAFQKLVVYATRSELVEISDAYRLFRLQKVRDYVVFVTIADSRVKYLKDVDNFVYLKDFLKMKNKFISNLNTVFYIKETCPDIKIMYALSILKYINLQLYKDIEIIYDFIRNNKDVWDHDFTKNSLYTEIKDYADKYNLHNFKIKALIDNNKRNLEGIRKLGPYLEYPSYPYWGQVDGYIKRELLNSIRNICKSRGFIRLDYNNYVQHKDYLTKHEGLDLIAQNDL